MAHCLHCDDSSTARGLCYKCYKRAWRYIKAEKGTWEELEASGAVLKPKGNPFDVNAEGLTPDEQTLALLRQGNKVTVEANQPLIKQLEEKIKSGKPSLFQQAFLPGQQPPQGQKAVAAALAACTEAPTPKVPDPVSESLGEVIDVDSEPVSEWPNPLAGAPPAQGDYEPEDLAPTGCEPPEAQVPRKTYISQKDLYVLYGPLSKPPQPDPKTVTASMEAIDEGRTQPIENFLQAPEPDPTLLPLEETKQGLAYSPIDNFFRNRPDLHSGQEENTG